MGVMSVVIKAVTPSIRLDGTNVNPTHLARRSQVGLPERRPAGASKEGSAVSGEPPPLTGSPLRDSASSSSWAGAGSERHNITAEAKTSTTSSPYPTDHQRVAQKPYDAAQVRGPVQEVGVPGGWVVGVGQPTLDQGVRSGNREKWESDGHQHQPEQQEDRVGLR